MKKIYCALVDHEIDENKCDYTPRHAACISCKHRPAPKVKVEKQRPKQPVKKIPTKERSGKNEFKEWVKLHAHYPQSHLLDFLERSGIKIQFPNVGGTEGFYFWPADDYFTGKAYEAPSRLVDAITDDNELILKIDLNHQEVPMRKDFSRIVSLALKELGKHGRKTFRMSSREYKEYLQVARLMQSGLTNVQIAQKISPSVFKDPVTKLTKGRRLIKAIGRCRVEIEKFIKPEKQ